MITNIEGYLAEQERFSAATFGPGMRTNGLVEHIKKELQEIQADPTDLNEWIDVIILALDGYWRHGGSPTAIMPLLSAKLDRNRTRQWPNWRTLTNDDPIEHVR